MNISNILSAVIVLLTVTTTTGVGAGVGGKRKSIVIPPLDHLQEETNLATLGIVLLQGADIPVSGYIPLVQAIQKKSSRSFNLWIALPHCTLDICEPTIVPHIITEGIKELVDSGFPKEGPIVVGGHSLGGAFVQDWAFANHEDYNVVGQLLLGAFITRKNRISMTSPGSGRSRNSIVPTLTLTGSLDGLSRVSRIAESYYHEVLHQTITSSGATTTTTTTTKSHCELETSTPVVVIPGMSHMQFSSSDPPLLVRQRDFQPEISLEHAVDKIAEIISAFLVTSVHVDTTSTSSTTTSSGIRGWWFSRKSSSNASSSLCIASKKVINDALATTHNIVMPLISSLELEGFIHFKPPCNSDNVVAQCPFYPRYPDKQQSDIVETDCTCGTPWSITAQTMMAGYLSSDKIDIKVTDAIHSVADVRPIHLPHIWSETCASPLSCSSVNVTTVTQSVHGVLDELDTGFGYVSADELRVKMKSRQTMWMAIGEEGAVFHDTDEVPDTCSEINQAAYTWALNHAPKTVLTRFEQHGQPLEFGKDSGPYNAGPLWIYNSLKYDEKSDKSAVVVTSPMMHTPYDYPIKTARGFHYCKLLSPARAMEWIYVDGLRSKLKLNRKKNKQLSNNYSSSSSSSSTNTSDNVIVA